IHATPQEAAESLWLCARIRFRRRLCSGSSSGPASPRSGPRFNGERLDPADGWSADVDRSAPSSLASEFSAPAAGPEPGLPSNLRWVIAKPIPEGFCLLEGERATA